MSVSTRKPHNLSAMVYGKFPLVDMFQHIRGPFACILSMEDVIAVNKRFAAEMITGPHARQVWGEWYPVYRRRVVARGHVQYVSDRCDALCREFERQQSKRDRVQAPVAVTHSYAA